MGSVQRSSEATRFAVRYYTVLPERSGRSLLYEPGIDCDNQLSPAIFEFLLSYFPFTYTAETTPLADAPNFLGITKMKPIVPLCCSTQPQRNFVGSAYILLSAAYRCRAKEGETYLATSAPRSHYSAPIRSTLALRKSSRNCFKKEGGCAAQNLTSRIINFRNSVSQPQLLSSVLLSFFFLSLVSSAVNARLVSDTDASLQAYAIRRPRLYVQLRGQLNSEESH